MSTLVATLVPCPRCGVETTHDIAVGVHGGRAGKLRQAILDGAFQRYTCAACLAPYRVEEPFTYIDPGRKHFFMCFPERDEGRWSELEGESARLYHDNVETNASPIAKPLMADMWIRTVFGVDALREKLVIGDAGLDDRVVEVLKLELVRSLGGLLHPARRPRLVETPLGHLVLELWKHAERWERRTLPRAVYDHVAASEAHRELVAQLGAGPYVDLGRIMLSAPENLPSA